MHCAVCDSHPALPDHHRTPFPPLGFFFLLTVWSTPEDLFWGAGGDRQDGTRAQAAGRRPFLAPCPSPSRAYFAGCNTRCGARWRVGMEGMASKGGTLMGVPIQGTAVQKGDRHGRWRVSNTGEVRKQEEQKSKPESWGTRGARRPPTSPRCSIRRASSHRCRRRRRGKEGAMRTAQ